jgi:hypothetical protein
VITTTTANLQGMPYNMTEFLMPNDDVARRLRDAVDRRRWR